MMTLDTNLAASFAAFTLAGMTVIAEWSPSNGASVMSANVLMDEPDTDIFGGTGISREYAIAYPSSQLIGLQEGEIVTIADTAYTVRRVRQVDDGKLTRASLAKD